MKYWIVALSVLFFLAVSIPNLQAESETEREVLTFKTPEAESAYHALIEELRCLVCQNQNLAGSNADLAKDLRSKVYEMVESGQSQDAIIDYMVTRYGDFVLYRPPFKIKTLMLWLGPIIFLLLALWLVVRWVRSQQTVKSTATLSDEQREAVRDLLDKHK
ncbi:MAG: cytochrome C biogenesis protein CcmH [Proteobacteria bacterium]|nr:MAG: cytochrome C biogenesis protein CcmH [Pseudomonadota bacterium]